MAKTGFGKWAAKTYDAFAARGAFRRAYRWHFEYELREFLRRFTMQTGDVVVDVGCGTGNHTLAFARRAAAGVAVGLDLSWAMLQLFQRHAERERAANAVAVWGNALNLPSRSRDASVPKLFVGCLHREGRQHEGQRRSAA